MSLNVVFGADNLVPPLTGIGRYAFEIASGLEKHQEIDSLRYYCTRGWVSDPLSRLHKKNRETNAIWPRQTSIREKLAKNSMAVQLYCRVAPHLDSWRLRKVTSRTIFHSPNFMAPSCPARKATTIHDLSHELYPAFHPPARVELMKWVFPLSLSRSDQIITVSESVKRELIDHYAVAEERITVTPLGVDARFKPLAPDFVKRALRDFRLEPGGYVLFVGTVEPRKNIERLLDAFSGLRPELRAQWPLVIAGGKGWQSESIHARIHQAASEGWVRYLTYVDEQRLPALYAGARLMVYPSLYEGFGLPVLEAMASGAPVITSQTASMPEVAGDAARLINPEDQEELTVVLEECLTSEEWLAAARERGLRRARSFSWEGCVNKTIEVYKKATG